MIEDLRDYVEVVDNHLREYVTHRDESAYMVLTLWTLGTFFMRSWMYYPHLYIRAGMFESGKSTLGKAMLCATANPYPVGKATFASFMDHIDKAEVKPTAFLDDAHHKYFGFKPKEGRFQEFLIDSWDSSVPYTKQHRVNKSGSWTERVTDQFVPTIYATNTCRVPPEITSRSISTQMVKVDDPNRKDFNFKIQRPFLLPYVERVQRHPSDYFKDYMETTKDTGLSSRDRQNWMSLIALGDFIGREYKEIRGIALDFSQRNAPQDEEANITQLVVESACRHFHTPFRKRMGSVNLRKLVNGDLRDHGVRDLDQVDFVSIINGFGIRSGQVWISEDKENKHGYKIEDWYEVWRAYCPELLKELEKIQPPKAIEPDVSQNGHDSLDRHALDAIAAAKSFVN